ncbi:PilN domain-containing protein [Litorilinea aerophila]|uniref:PilN domain-containing protein n=1 Tax=Litorilinea aerophila TaxID=1204385 RepID=A0A540VDV4_9CHLR|nr:PilN domain-containing protein [Litorilinea aerophila]MCC9077392.1 PilN domain-containing protein [Litorilinea aerophila]OUC08895.1 hypothetical protein RY27_06260 [Litorilinea aerophila]GIV76266.1 MAG: hypothetical protein KatS3mg050_0660 [Litorilinea sp.]
MLSEQQYGQTGEQLPTSQGTARRRALIAWLLACSLLFLLLALILAWSRTRSHVVQLENALVGVEQEILLASTPAAQTLTLSQQLTQTQGLIDRLSALSSTVDLPWPSLVPVLANYDRRQISFTSLKQDGRTILLTGKATDPALVSEYATMLEASGLFANVARQRIAQAQEAPQGDSASPSTPGAAATPQPPLQGVEFELLLEVKARLP